MKYFLTCFLFFTSLLFISSCNEYQDVTITGVENVKVIKLDQTGIELELSVRIKNPNTIGFTIYKPDLDAMINGVAVGKLKVSKRIHVNANSEDLHTFRVSTDFSKLSPEDAGKMLSLAFSKSGNLAVKGKIKVGNIFYRKTFPVEKTQKIKF
jgi:LEA14-like dessication related protein